MLLWINRILVSLVVVMFIITCTVIYLVTYKNTLPEVHAHSYQILPESYNAQNTLTKDEITNLVNTEFEFSYLLFFTNFNDSFIEGRASLFFNIIEIKATLNGAHFAIVLTHELVHLKYNTNDERFTNFHTFIILYESQSPYLNYCAIVFANKIFSHSVYPTAYDCCYYITEYL